MYWGLGGSAPTLTKCRACAQKKVAKSVTGGSEEEDICETASSVQGRVHHHLLGVIGSQQCDGVLAN